MGIELLSNRVNKREGCSWKIDRGVSHMTVCRRSKAGEAMAAMGYLTEYLCYVLIVLACKCMHEEIKRLAILFG
jgi:hypothetical protein